tara:strand:- start:3655 stop:4296 length:642 start_codon:yes stop_codon:yes gene_type:complete
MITRLINKILTVTGRKIIQFSPQRSGSTLVFNILQDLFPTRYINKQHNYDLKDKNFPTVITYRHPYDCIASLILKDQVSPTDQIIEDKIMLFRKDGWNDFLNQFESPKILFLRYENFYNDIDFILNSIEGYFKIHIGENKRVKLRNKYKISSVKKEIEKFKSFSEFDSRSHFHGNHISKYLGTTNSYKKLFNTNQIRILEKHFNDEKRYLNYE